jgi:hypothetical protein
MSQESKNPASLEETIKSLTALFEVEDYEPIGGLEDEDILRRLARSEASSEAQADETKDKASAEAKP